VWVQGGKREGLYRKTFDEATDGVVTTLLQSSSPSNLAYIADWDGGRLNHKVDGQGKNKRSACFYSFFFSFFFVSSDTSPSSVANEYLASRAM
jgi:hypothetical protein